MRRLGNIVCLLMAISLAISSCDKKKDGVYTLTVLSTTDMHGQIFDLDYRGNHRPSIYSISYAVDSIRNQVGKDNVVLVDAGDFSQGDNSGFYFNYINTSALHPFPEMVHYMDYDAVCIGNHDIESGHEVYDRTRAKLNKYGIPYLGGNAIRDDNGQPYFDLYKIVKKNGLKVAILGFTNPLIEKWTLEERWSGMHFEELIPLVQQDVDMVREKENPDVVIVVVHDGVGKDDGSTPEFHGLNLFNTLQGVDFLVCGHDHKPNVHENEDICLLNPSGSCKDMGVGTITLTYDNGKLVSKKLSAKLDQIDGSKVDEKMKKKFAKEYEMVRSFTMDKIGVIDTDIWTRDAFGGMSHYMNLVHKVSLFCYPAEISLAAPLAIDAHVHKGDFSYNDIFTLYPYENKIYVIKMTGEEIKNYLEYSYDHWIQSPSVNGHVLKINETKDVWTGREGWNLEERYYIFDSAGGLYYKVDVTKPYGQRVQIDALANGKTFKPESTYNVAITSFRVSGGGDMLMKGANIDAKDISSRYVYIYSDIHELLYNYVSRVGSLHFEDVDDPKEIGYWEFAPESAKAIIADDMNLLFGEDREANDIHNVK